jgi:hypothetical protein
MDITGRKNSTHSAADVSGKRREVTVTATHNNIALARSIEAPAEAVWASIARGYASFRSPLVPCREDIAALERAVALHAHADGGESRRAIMLGVTPGIALMDWPSGTRILAAEQSQAVIDALWPGDIPGVREAVCASWFSLPVGRNSVHVVVGDGSLSTCRFPGEVRDLVLSICNLLADHGLLAFRSYLRPQVQETVDAVFDDLFGPGLTVDRFKMRLFLAMQRSAQEGVAVVEAARILDKYNLSPRTMQEWFGWSSAAVEPFKGWKTSPAVYSFPTLDELRQVLGECFDELKVEYPSYELGHCCPTLVMRSTGTRRKSR